ncbi:MAG: 3-hydroxyacyl-CoA dehydrogenase [Alphaproteobacteria bacterium]|nr:MAG: 3-hydroxyacyl-CoA dehydrogenase [Alphaproteobacteria bacterium]
MTSPVSYERKGSIAVVTADNPPVNALGQAVRQGLVDAVERAAGDDAVKAVVIRCAGRTFFAGADIREFGKPPLDPPLRRVHEVITECPKPVVAAIHGTALGGGFETALACHYRIAVPSAKVGTPEVNLGILPGAGGTQRLPRLVGVENALELVVFGRPVGAKQALAMGAIDEIAKGDLEADAIAYAERLVAEGAPLRKVSDLPIEKTPEVEAAIARYRERIARERRGFFAPQRCIDAVEAAVTLPFEEGMARERELFNECMANPQSRAQRYAFFAEREAGSVPGIGKQTPIREIRAVAVIGAGTMGGGIAMNFADIGLPVTIVEASDEALERGLGVVRRNYESAARKARITAAEVDARMALITGVTDYQAVADADLIIEAVYEDMALKKDIFGTLDAVAKEGAILATNTSTLDVDEIAAVTGRPGDVIGLHFFSPANVMRLLEIVRGAKTTEDVIATAMKMAKKIGKVGVLSGVCYGFIGNRMLDVYAREAELMLLEGATPARIDKALYDFGMAMGPFAMFDLAGVDVAWKTRESHRDRAPKDPSYYHIGDLLAEMGRHGQKVGRGYYKYEEGSRTPIPDPEVEALIRSEAQKLGIEQREVDDTEIVARCLYPMINEGARILEEGIALRPGDIDTVWINGYGFPVYRGGPMFYGGEVGLDKVLAAIETYRERYGERFWTPSPLLEKLAKAGKTFAQWKDV